MAHAAIRGPNQRTPRSAGVSHHPTAAGTERGPGESPVASLKREAQCGGQAAVNTPHRTDGESTDLPSDFVLVQRLDVVTENATDKWGVSCDHVDNGGERRLGASGKSDNQDVVKGPVPPIVRDHQIVLLAKVLSNDCAVDPTAHRIDRGGAHRSPADLGAPTPSQRAELGLVVRTAGESQLLVALLRPAPPHVEARQPRERGASGRHWCPARSRAAGATRVAAETPCRAGVQGPPDPAQSTAAACAGPHVGRPSPCIT